MGYRGAGRYAVGDKAVAICERCSVKTLRKYLVYDGQFPDLLVCPDCWDPKHPQEYLPPAFDPVTIYDPTGDPDKAQANTQFINFPPRDDGLTAIDPTLPLQVGVTINAQKFNLVNGDGTGEIPGPVLISPVGNKITGANDATARPPLPGAGADPDSMGSVTEGMLMMAIAAVRDPSNNAENTIDSGWNTLVDFQEPSGSVNHTLFYKIATASETAPTKAQPFGDVKVFFDEMLETSQPTAMLDFFSSKLPVLLGDRVLSVFFPDVQTFGTITESGAADTAICDNADPKIIISDWASGGNLEATNLLGTTDSDGALTGFSTTPVAMTIGDYSSGGQEAKIGIHNAVSEETYFSKTVPVVLGQDYWFGAHTGVHRSSGDPDWLWMSVDDGTTEDGFFYQSVMQSGVRNPIFGNNIGSGHAVKFSNLHARQGTLAYFKWTATITGSVTFRLGMTQTSTSKVHTTNMDGTLRGIPIMATWVCDGNTNHPNLPVVPPYIQSAARTDWFNSLHWSWASRPFGSNAFNIVAVIRSKDNEGVNHSHYPWKQWPCAVNVNHKSTENEFWGPDAGTETGTGDKIYAGPLRKCNEGKYYFEVEYPATQPPVSTNFWTSAGIFNPGGGEDNLEYIGESATLHGAAGYGVRGDGLRVFQAGQSNITALTAISAGDILGFAVDFDNDTIDYYINNTLEQELMVVGGAKTFDDITHYAPAFTTGSNNNSARMIGKLRASEFTFTPPIGFSAWSPE
jgi:hypothetical protein